MMVQFLPLGPMSGLPLPAPITKFRTARSIASSVKRAAWAGARGSALATVVGCGFFVGSMSAQNVIWGNTATAFNSDASWSGGGAPTSANTAEFSGTPAFQPNVSAAITVQALRFSSGDGWTLSGSGGAVTVLLVGQALWLNTGTNVATATINANVIFGAATNNTQTVVSGSSNTLTLNGVLSSTNSLNVSLNNAGTFVLNGVNTYTGTTLWNNSSRTTIVGNAAAFGTSSLAFNTTSNTIKAGADLTGANKLTNPITFVSSPTFKNDLGYNLELGGTVSLSGGPTLTANTGTTSFSGAISGASVTLAGANGGKFVFTGANTYTDGTTIPSGGALVLGSATTLHSATGTLLVSGGALTTSVAATTVGGDLTFSSGTIALNGPSAGSLTLAAGKTFTMSGGTLNLTLGAAFDQIVSAGSAALSLSGGTISFDTSGAGFSYASSYRIFSGFASTSFGSVSLSGYDTSGYTGAISDAGMLTFSATAIPEPSTYAALVGALALGFAEWRRRRAHDTKPQS